MIFGLKWLKFQRKIKPYTSIWNYLEKNNSHGIKEKLLEQNVDLLNTENGLNQLKLFDGAKMK